MTAAASARGLSRRFGSTLVLRSVDLDVERGERVAVCGDNGAGKTTLLRAMAGLLRPTDGKLMVLGGTPDDPRVRKRVGVLGHNPFLYPRLSALENLRFWGRLYGVRDDKRARELLGTVGLDGDDRRPVSAYSQGMRQRAGLARALLHDPELLLLDEPFAGLDSGGADAIAHLLASDGRTLVFATHERPRAEQLGARVLVLTDGTLG